MTFSSWKTGESLTGDVVHFAELVGPATGVTSPVLLLQTAGFSLFRFGRRLDDRSVAGKHDAIAFFCIITSFQPSACAYLGHQNAYLRKVSRNFRVSFKEIHKLFGSASSPVQHQFHAW
mgnify:CR=1 FL=1